MATLVQNNDLVADSRNMASLTKFQIIFAVSLSVFMCAKIIQNFVRLAIFLESATKIVILTIVAINCSLLCKAVHSKFLDTCSKILIRSIFSLNFKKKMVRPGFKKLFSVDDSLTSLDTSQDDPSWIVQNRKKTDRTLKRTFTVPGPKTAPR